MAENKKTAAGKTTASTTTRKRVAKGDSYACEVCGLSVIVDEACGCAEVHEIICCGKPMKERRARAKAKAA